MDLPIRYSPSVQLFDIVEIYYETTFDEWRTKKANYMFHSPDNFKWEPVCIEINSTQINFYHLKNKNSIASVNRLFHCNRNSSKFSILERKRSDRLILQILENSQQLRKKSIENLINFGEVYKSYSMQFSSIGSAQTKDTKNYMAQRYNGMLLNTIRLRLQNDQFLVKCLDNSKYELLYHKLNCSKDISLPLELRGLNALEHMTKKKFRQTTKSERTSALVNSAIGHKYSISINTSSGTLANWEVGSDEIENEFLNKYLLMSSSRLVPLDWNEPWNLVVL